MSARLVVVGGGGFAKEICWLAQDVGWQVQGFLDDREEAQGQVLLGLPVLGRTGDWRRFGDASFVVAIGAPRTRRLVVQKMSEQGSPGFATLVHPSARLSRHVTLGDGTVVTAGCILTVDIAVGRHGIFNLGVTVGHECRIADFVTIAPLAAISGNVTLGECVEVGTGASIRQGLSMAAGSVLGMGGVLTRSVAEREVHVGNPAKHLRTLET